MVPFSKLSPIPLKKSQLHQRQSFDDISLFDVFFDDLGGVFAFDLGVERAVWIDHYGSAYRAEADGVLPRGNLLIKEIISRDNDEVFHIRLKSFEIFFIRRYNEAIVHHRSSGDKSIILLLLG